MTTLTEQQNRVLNFSSKELDDIKQKSKEGGIIIGREHSSMSVETSKHFDTMDAKMDKFEEKVDRLKEEFSDLRTEMKTGFASLPLAMRLEMEKTIKDVLEETDKRYANKLSEKMVYATAGVMLLGIVGALVALVIK